MPIAKLGAVDLCFEEHGDRSNPPLVLVMGFTAQLTSWPIDFVEALVGRGYWVIRFDNRDSGLSTKTSGPPPDLASVLTAVAAGTPDEVEAAYDLGDMAEDVIRLLDHLGVRQAHVVGASMGGMIVQHLAIEHAARLLSATSIMSTSGDPTVGAGDPEVTAALLEPAPVDREAAIAHGTEVSRLLSGPLWDRKMAEQRTRQSLERSTHPLGALFQLAAMAASGDRSDRLKNVELPFLVIHGAADRLINSSGGRATAAAVPNAKFIEFKDMGHDIPAPLITELVDAISVHCSRATETTRP